MRIAINALSAKTGGGVIYLNRLIYYLREIDNQDEYYIFVTRDNHGKIIAFKDPRFHVIQVSIRSLLHRLLYEQFALPISVKRFNIDIVYAPAEIAPLMAPCPVVLGIQNSNIYYSVAIKRSIIEKFRLWILRYLAKVSSQKANRIIFVSNTARKDIVKKLKASPAKTRAIYHGVELDNFAKLEIGENLALTNQITGSNMYILCLSNLDRHKNIEVLIKAYATLGEKYQSQYKLIIAGRKVPPYGDELSGLVHQLNLGRKIDFTGEIPFGNVPSLYQGSSLFVLPSYLESFGIPLIEAMACGVPVIAANISAIPEVISDAGLLFDPNDPDELRAKIEAILSNQNLRKKLIQKGLQRVKTFSWEKCAKETLAVFREKN